MRRFAQLLALTTLAWLLVWSPIGFAQTTVTVNPDAIAIPASGKANINGGTLDAVTIDNSIFGPGNLVLIENNLTARAGGGQALATATSPNFNVHITTAVATPGDSMKTVPCVFGQVHRYVNATSKAMQLFGNSPETINGAATGTGITIPGLQGVDLTCETTGVSWRTSAAVIPGTWRALTTAGCTDGTSSTFTGSTSETVFRSCTIPAGSMGPKGQVRFWAVETYPNNANAKTMNARWHGLAGTLIATTPGSVNLVTNMQGRVSNMNSVSAQSLDSWALNGSTTLRNLHNTDTLNTNSADRTIDFTCTLAVSGDNCTIESLTIEVLYGAMLTPAANDPFFALESVVAANDPFFGLEVAA